MMDASECKNCKRFVGYEYSDHGNPYVLCYWRSDPGKPWSRDEHQIAVEVEKVRPAMSRKELRKWLKSPHGKLRYMQHCWCYEKEEMGQLSIV
jgi:hypothetical protein